MHKDIPQDWQLRVQRADLTKVGFKRGAEALECGGRVELCDLVLDLLGYQLALQVYCLVSTGFQGAADAEGGGNTMLLLSRERLSVCIPSAGFPSYC